MQFMKYL